MIGTSRKMHLCCVHEYGCCGRNRLGLNGVLLCSDSPTNYGQIRLKENERKEMMTFRDFFEALATGRLSEKKGSREKK